MALPNGEHLTRREPVSGIGGGGVMAMSAAAPVFTPPVSSAPKAADVFGQDRLASWAIWCTLFVVLSVTLIGGAIGGVIAAVASVPVGMMLPTRPDGRKLPAWLSIALIAASVFVFFGSAVFVALQR
ncbi:MAG TPA: hypothetical protein VLK84_10015 [Longimicrobium sp.]|nr:hypothetical protein [Longimicrobium sp.]